MGSLAREPFAGLILDIAARGGHPYFIETGTHTGNTTRWAAAAFVRVITIEVEAKYRDMAIEKSSAFGNIVFLSGRSTERLDEALDAADAPAVFWLDAHKGGGWYGAGDDCSIIEELGLIAARRRPGDLILIDDARGFLAPPPPPFDPDAWPTIHAVLDAADPDRSRYVVILNDVIIVAPPAMKTLIRDFCAAARPKI